MKIPKFVNCTFIIHKNGNKTRIQPILISNSTTFMFNNIFCAMKGKKVTQWDGAGGNGGTVLITSWKCNFSIYLDIRVYYLDIQAIKKFFFTPLKNVDSPLNIIKHVISIPISAN